MSCQHGRAIEPFLVEMFQILITKLLFSHLDKNNEHTNLHALKQVDCTTMQKEWSKFDSVVANLH
jgi:hypothetical protein